MTIDILNYRHIPGALDTPDRSAFKCSSLSPKNIANISLNG